MSYIAIPVVDFDDFSITLYVYYDARYVGHVSSDLCFIGQGSFGKATDIFALKLLSMHANITFKIIFMIIMFLLVIGDTPVAYGK